jgi:hypothetical protein
MQVLYQLKATALATFLLAKSGQEVQERVQNVPGHPQCRPILASPVA